MNKEKVIKTLKEAKIIAIVRGVEGEKILPACEALYKGGIKCVEVTFNQSSELGNKDTFDAIKTLTENFGDKMCIGSGTVMSVEQVELAVKAGAKFIISPNFDKDVVKRTVELGAVSIPGVLTPTEIADCFKAGASFAKVFPAGEIGLEYLKAIKAPISHIPMLAVGGVSLDNMKNFFAIGIEGVGVGSSLVDKALINESKFDELTELARRFVNKI